MFLPPKASSSSTTQKIKPPKMASPTPAEMALLSQQLESIRKILGATSIQSVITQPDECYFLEKIPIEIRKIVYRYLLINPILAFNDAVEVPGLKLGLSPNILSACHQVYDEATDVLYGENTFIFQSLQCDHADCRRSPVLAKCNGCHAAACHCTSCDEAYLSLETSPTYSALKKTKHWKFVVSSVNTRPLPCPTIVTFARMLAHCDALVSLEVLVVPQGKESDHSYTSPGWEDKNGPSDYHKLEDIVKPFRMLGKLAFFAFQDATPRDIPSSYSDTSLNSRELPANLEYELKLLIQGKTRAEYAFKLHQQTALYAQAFESHPDVKEKMNVTFNVADQDRRDRDELWDDEDQYYSGNYSKIKNPYRQPLLHPVEAALELSSSATGENDVDTVKSHRKAVLEYLEPQYQRIVAASTAVNEFVKDHKTPGGIFDFDGENGEKLYPNVNLQIQDYAMAYTLARNYYNSFKRDSTPQISIQIASARPEFQLWYDNQKRTHFLNYLKQLVVLKSDWVDFSDAFKELITELDTQYLQIRKARKVLFEHDTWGTRGCDIDPETWRSDEMVKWDIYEPLFGALNKEGVCTPQMRIASRSWGDISEYKRSNTAERYKWGNGSHP